MKSWSLRRRLTLAVVGIVGLVLVGLAAALFVAVKASAWEQHDAGLTGRALALISGAEHEDGGYELVLPGDLDDPRPFYAMAFTDATHAIARSPSLGAATLPCCRAKAGPPQFFDLVLPDGRSGRAVEVHAVPRDEGDPVSHESITLVLAEGTEDVAAAVARVRTAFLGLAALALLAVAGATVWLLGRGLQPLTRLGHQLEKIDDTSLRTRLRLADQPAELAAPVRKLEELLARLDAAFTREREFTSDVSHELRTPLAGLRTLLEVTALTDRSTAEYKSALSEARTVVLELGTLIENLLLLARIDHGQLSIEPHEVPLRELVDAAWKPHADAAARRGLAFANELPADRVATTDREKLKIVVSNLLANAAEYTAAGGTVTVAVGDSDAVLDVIDSGPTIPAEHLPKIFDRLWRGDVARAATGVHCGIGLALARSLCGTLGYALTAANLPDGSVRFRIVAC